MAWALTSENIRRVLKRLRQRETHAAVNGNCGAFRLAGESKSN